MNVKKPITLIERVQSTFDHHESFSMVSIASPEGASTSIGYYRTKLFTISGYDNALLNAASPLLVLATSLKNTSHSPALTSLYNDLCHEIKAFVTKMNNKPYAQTEILAARYILCAFLDEVILNTSWGAKSPWHKQNLLDTFQKEMAGQDKFFTILECSITDPVNHVDLLELIYICLSLGYAGKYRHHEKGSQILSEIVDTLYTLLQQQKGEIDKKAVLHYQITSDKQRHAFPWLIFGISVLLSLLIVLGIYFGFEYLLADKIKIPALTTYARLNSTPV